MKNPRLEGPKRHHDYHGKDASVPGKGSPVPGEHWERRYDTCEPSANMKATQGAAFAPMRAKDRKTTYVKINETDH